MSGSLPIVLTASGLQPTPPSQIRANLESSISSTNPGYTANLPGSLIEDMLSTEVASVALCDSARVELVNSLTPYGANAFLLNQLGQIYGVQLGVGFNTSVQLVFSGSVGFPIPQGFVVSDGTYQYICQTGGIIGSGGSSGNIFAVATQSGTWAVPSGSVTQLVTSVPSTISLSVTNPLAGIASTTAQTEGDYRSQVLQAGLAVSQGMPQTLRTALQQVSGVQSRLISIRSSGGSWEIIVGGGDQYQVAYAIFMSLFDISTLVGSTLNVVGITNANPGVMTTGLNHGFATGQVINVTGVVGMTGINSTPLTITVLSETTFSLGINTTSSGTYTSGGVVTPNLRNVSVSINDYPDVYVIPFVNPPQQSVSISLTWNTTATNVVSPAAVAQMGSVALVNYINSIPVGQPINLFDLQSTFQTAIVSLVPAALLTRMVFSVSINGIGVSPTAGTGIIAGDPESYFQTSTTAITITQG